MSCSTYKKLGAGLKYYHRKRRKACLANSSVATATDQKLTCHRKFFPAVEARGFHALKIKLRASHPTPAQHGIFNFLSQAQEEAVFDISEVTTSRLVAAKAGVSRNAVVSAPKVETSSDELITLAVVETLKTTGVDMTATVAAVEAENEKEAAPAEVTVDTPEVADVDIVATVTSQEVEPKGGKVPPAEAAVVPPNTAEVNMSTGVAAAGTKVGTKATAAPVPEVEVSVPEVETTESETGKATAPMEVIHFALLRVNLPVDCVP